MGQITGLQGVTDMSFGHVVSVTTSDSVDLAVMCQAIRATAAGNIKITCPSGATPTLAFAAAETRYVRATRIWATGTTATGIEAMS